MNKFIRASKVTAVISCSVLTIIGIVRHQHPELHTSQQGMALIGNVESCRRDPYYCSAHELTVGIGSTSASGTPIIPSKHYSDQEIAQRFALDLSLAEQCVMQFGNGRNMPQGAFDAMVSLTFNVGCHAVKRSTLFRYARQGYRPQMCDEFRRWVYANGQKLTGLVNRREKERTRCLQR